MTNATTMPRGSYDTSHIARWSGLVASCEATKRRQRASARAVLTRRTPWLSSSSSMKTQRHNQLLASDYGTFLLTKARFEHQYQDMKGTPYSAHQSDELRRLQSVHGCSQRAQLVGITLGRLRRQKLAEKLIFFGSSKKSGRRYATTAVKLLKARQFVHKKHIS